MQKMLEQAQKVQSKMQEMQQNYAKQEVVGSAAADMVQVTATCKGEIVSIDIDNSLLKESEKEMLEDLLKAAINNAKAKADATINEATKDMMKELGMPPNFKMPF